MDNFKQKNIPERYKKSISEKMKGLKHALALPPELNIPEVIPGSFSGENEISGEFYPNENKIYINQNYMRGAPAKEIAAHELQHAYESNPIKNLLNRIKGVDTIHTEDKEDLMYPKVNVADTPQKLAQKLRKKAIQNLEKQEKELVDRNQAVYPRPIKEVYEEIQKKKPMGKPFWENEFYE